MNQLEREVREVLRQSDAEVARIHRSIKWRATSRGEVWQRLLEIQIDTAMALERLPKNHPWHATLADTLKSRGVWLWHALAGHSDA